MQFPQLNIAFQHPQELFCCWSQQLYLLVQLSCSYQCLTSSSRQIFKKNVLNSLFTFCSELNSRFIWRAAGEHNEVLSIYWTYKMDTQLKINIVLCKTTLNRPPNLPLSNDITLFHIFFSCLVIVFFLFWCYYYNNSFNLMAYARQAVTQMCKWILKNLNLDSEEVREMGKQFLLLIEEAGLRLWEWKSFLQNAGLYWWWTEYK